MRPRFSILNLLQAMTIVALVIVVFRLHVELATEKSLRLQLLQKGGILQVGDPAKVHVVQVSALGEPNTMRWRVYVPDRRNVTLNARLESVPADKPLGPRLPPNAIVVAERSPSNPIELGPGEHVISLSWDAGLSPYLRFKDLKLDVAGDGPRYGRSLRANDGLDWIFAGSRKDITHLEHSTKTARMLQEGRTVTLADGKTFVLCRLRELKSHGALHQQAPGRKIESPTDKMGEVLIWLHPDGQ